MLRAMRRAALFARVPEPGQVKTRLSPALPAAQAAALYRAMLDDAVAALRDAAADERFVYWAEAGDAALAPGLGLRTQSAGDLGARLASAFAELLRDPPAAAVICGADCPTLTAGRIDRALHELASADLVLAPSNDGGYGMIGLRRSDPALFAGVAWSTDRAADQTLANAARLGFEVTMLEPLDDVDTPEDLCRLVAWAALRHDDRTATRAALRDLGLLPAKP
jgi:rSAM/selenodomain-associated transferase 1